MLKLLAVAALVSVAAAAAVPQRLVYRPLPLVQVAPRAPDSQTYVVREQPSNNIGLDRYRYSYELSDGQTREESAQLDTRGFGVGEGVLRVRGSYSYVDPHDGRTFTVSYVADENGFQPRASHLPRASVF